MVCRMRRTAPLLFTLCLCLSLQLNVAVQMAPNNPAANNSTCNRTPMGTSVAPQLGDNGYEVKVLSLSGEEIFRFRPGHTYSITLTNRYPSVAFINFFMTAVPESVSPIHEFGNAVGTFSHVPNPPITRHSPSCPGMVEGVVYHSPMRLYSVKLHWTAPRYLMECVEFRTTVEAYPGEYFKDQGMLRKRICPHESFLYEAAPSSSAKLMTPSMSPERSANARMPADQAQLSKNMPDMMMEKKSDIMIPSIRDCCACGHATYQMVFQGLWTRQNHPRDWPTADSSVHWSNIIGASHSKDYLMYYFGGRASTAVKAMCELGDITPMEREFRDEARWNVLNVVKTSGIWGLSNLEEPRTALFSVNQTHHLMSMLTMVGPSTDWCTGVSALDLCETGCQWKKELSVDLYPWDAGTVQGSTYEPKHRNPEINQQPIKLIQPTWMTNQPFSTGKNDDVLPVARLTIKRIRPKSNWQCERQPMSGVLNLANIDENQQNTAANSNTKRRTNGKAGKKRPLWQETPGDRGSDERGMGLIQPMMLKKILTRCQHSPWSEWSPCSVSCGGSGVRHRTRTLLVNMLPQKCRLFDTKNTEVCDSKLRVCPFEKCAVSGWTSWSPCNATCSTAGVSETRRHFTFQQYTAECTHLAIPMSNFTSCTLPQTACDPMMLCKEAPNSGLACFRGPSSKIETNNKVPNAFYYNVKQDRCLPFIFKGCKGNHNKFSTKMACEEFCQKGLSSLTKNAKARLAQQQMVAINLMNSQNNENGGQCEQPVESGRACQPGEQTQVQQLTSLTMGGEGQSSGLILWYFNKMMRQCMPFTFLGCGGNVNRFSNEMDCMKDCKHLMIDVGESQDCRVSPWGAWQPCSRQCGGSRQRQRTIVAAAKFGGESCPPLYERATCPSCCPYSPWSSWSACSSTCRDPESLIPPMRERSRRKLIAHNNQGCSTLPLTERSICTAENLRACPVN